MNFLKCIFLICLSFCNVALAQSRIGEKKQISVNLAADRDEKRQSQDQSHAMKLTNLLLKNLDDYVACWDFDLESYEIISEYDGILELKISKNFNERKYSTAFYAALIRQLKYLGLNPSKKPALSNSSSIKTNTSIKQESLFNKKKTLSPIEEINMPKLKLPMNSKLSDTVFYLEEFSKNDSYLNFIWQNLKDNPYALEVEFCDSTGKTIDSFYIKLHSKFNTHDYGDSLSFSLSNGSINLLKSSLRKLKDTKTFRVKPDCNFYSIKTISIKVIRLDPIYPSNTYW